MLVASSKFGKLIEVYEMKWNDAGTGRAVTERLPRTNYAGRDVLMRVTVLNVLFISQMPHLQFQFKLRV